MVNVRKRLNLNHIVSSGLDQGNALPGRTHIMKGLNQGNALPGRGHVTKGANRGNALNEGQLNHRLGLESGNIAVGFGGFQVGLSWGNGGGNALGGGTAPDWRIDDNSYNYPDPALAFNFGLKIGDEVEALFTECTGLKIKRKPFMYKEGGYNDFTHKLVDRTEYDDVKLKRGITASNALWEWYLKGLETNIVELRNITIMLLKPTGDVLKRWHLIEAFPIEWGGPDLKTDSSTVAFETMTLTYHRLTTDSGD